MIFYRSPASQGGGPALSTLRTFIAVALIAYPVGCLVMLLGHHTKGQFPFDQLIGFGLMVIGLLSAAPVMGSRLQRIVGDVPSKLDEMELQQRHKAMNGAYMTFTAVFLAAIAYLALASDKGWWVPTGYGQWTAVFWGVFLYSTLIPTTILAWTMPEERD